MAGIKENTDLWEEYQNDTRISCKYGLGCYQKNPQHHKRFKHPPKRKISESDSEEKESDSPPKKQQRREDDEDSTLSNAAEPRKNDQSVSDNEDDSPQSETLKPETEEDEAGSDEDEDEVILTPSPEDVRESIKQKFLLDMPDDFYDFWEFCSTINKENPEDALSCGGLQLVGPYDVLTGKLKKLNKRSLSQYLCHWRYYHDPPEFQIQGGRFLSPYSVGYKGEGLRRGPIPLGPRGSLTIQPSFRDYLPDHISKIMYLAHFNMAIKDADPFKKTSLQKLQKEIESFANDKEYSLATKTPEMKARDKKKVTNSFHGAGIVVPFDKKTDVGYREIPETNADLKRMLRRIKEAKSDDDRLKRYDDLQELITNVQWANDEGDFGMGLELGIDLLMFGGEEFHSSIRHLLSVAYDLLNRQPFATIIESSLTATKAKKEEEKMLQ
ncbi:unnamed protein product, partial [Meganyctiphanes norvegica]